MRKLCDLPSVWRRPRRNVDPAEYKKATNTLETIASTTCLTLAAQKLFLHHCWDFQLPGIDLETELQPFETYFNHYEASSLQLPSSLSDFTHRDFCHVLQRLSDGTRQSCEAAVQADMSSSTLCPSTIVESIRFVGKAILLLDLSRWESNQTLAAYIAATLPSPSAQTDQFRFPSSFNAKNLHQIAGIQVSWSRDLLSHLHIGANMSSLTIFHHMRILELCEQSKFSRLFPSGFFEETRRTISLLIPGDKATKQWFNRQKRRLNLDPAAGCCRYLPGDQLQIQSFSFWRDRLIEAKDMYYLSQPTGLLQFWRDDRNKVQWWTFWIAVMVFMLTLMGIMEGALQVYKAYYPTKR